MDEAKRSSDAPLPETMEGLRRQNSAYRALCASLEAQMSVLTEKGREYQEAVTTLDSEREANAILTAENGRLTEERDALGEALEGVLSWWPENSEHGSAGKGSAFAADVSAARAALSTIMEQSDGR